MKVIYLNDLDGLPYVVEKPEGQDTLPFLQALVEGLIECVSINSSTDVWVNEEGLYRNDFAVNGMATGLARNFTGHNYTLVGPAVVAGVTPNGETKSVGSNLLRTIIALHGDETYTVEAVLAIRQEQVEELRLQGALA